MPLQLVPRATLLLEPSLHCRIAPQLIYMLGTKSRHLEMGDYRLILQLYKLVTNANHQFVDNEVLCRFAVSKCCKSSSPISKFAILIYGINVGRCFFNEVCVEKNSKPGALGVCLLTSVHFMGDQVCMLTHACLSGVQMFTLVDSPLCLMYTSRPLRTKYLFLLSGH